MTTVRWSHNLTSLMGGGWGDKIQPSSLMQFVLYIIRKKPFEYILTGEKIRGEGGFCLTLKALKKILPRLEGEAS